MSPQALVPAFVFTCENEIRREPILQRKLNFLNFFKIYLELSDCSSESTLGVPEIKQGSAAGDPHAQREGNLVDVHFREVSPACPGAGKALPSLFRAKPSFASFTVPSWAVKELQNHKPKPQSFAQPCIGPIGTARPRREGGDRPRTFAKKTPCLLGIRALVCTLV